MFGLLGPNGAGKTTTVEILEGYRSRDAGAVEVLGADPQRAGRAWRERVGVVLQSSSLYPNLTVRESLDVFAGYYRAPRDVDEVIEIVGLDEKRDARVRTLSGGQQRRLDLGLALIGDPDLIFLDEPTTGFDPGARRTRLGDDSQPALARQDDPADDALPRRGRAARRPRRRAARRRDRARRGAVRADRRRGRDRDPLPARRRGDRRANTRADAASARADRPRRSPAARSSTSSRSAARRSRTSTWS